MRKASALTTTKTTAIFPILIDIDRDGAKSLIDTREVLLRPDENDSLRPGGDGRNERGEALLLPAPNGETGCKAHQDKVRYLVGRRRARTEHVADERSNA